MVHQVEMNGEIHEFPDEATPEMIQAALGLEKQKPSLEEMMDFGLNRPISRLRKDTLSAAGNLAGSIAEGVMEGVPSAIYQAANDPWRLARNTAAGAAGIPAHLANTAMNIPAYLEHLLNKSGESEIIKPHTPQIDVNKYQQEWVGGEETPEDKAIRDLINIMPVVGPMGKMAGKVGMAGVNKTFGKQNPILESNKIQNELLQKNIQSELTEATTAHELNKEAHEQAVGKSKQETGVYDPDKMQFRISEQDKKLEELRNQSEKLTTELDSLESPGEAPKKSGESAAHLDKTNQTLVSYENNLANIEKHHDEVKNMANEADQGIKEYLNHEGVHDVEVSSALAARGQRIEDYVKDRYNQFVQKIQDVNFQMPETAMANLSYSKMSPTELVKTYGAEAFEAIKKGKLDEFIKKKEKANSSQNPFEQKLMELAPQSTDISAADFLLKRRAFREALYELEKKKRNDKFSVLEEEQANQAISKGKKMKGEIEKALESGLGDFKPEFDEINKLYSEQVHPLRENSVMEAAKEGKLSGNILKDIRTNEPGMPLVRELVKQDPQILRNVIGQRLKAKPEEVFQPNALMREYLTENPELQKMIDNRNEAHAIAEKSKAQINNAKRKISEAKEEKKQATKTHGAYEKEYEAALKAYNKETKSRVQNKEQLEKQISEHESQINELESKKSKLNENMQQVREQANNKKISLKKKVELESKLKQLKSEEAEINAQITETKGYIRRGAYWAKALIHLGKKAVGV